jgi:hypothetical protein
MSNKINEHIPSCNLPRSRFSTDDVIDGSADDKQTFRVNESSRTCVRWGSKLCRDLHIIELAADIHTAEVQLMREFCDR